MRFDTDLCVIGAGSGGLSIASGAVQMGARVTLIERAAMGGDCLNHGCVPSKALLAAAKIAQTLRQGGGGVVGVEPQVDFRAVSGGVRAAIASIAPHDSQDRFERLGVRVIRQHARFTGPDTVEAGGQTLTARRFVIATGAQAAVPDLPGLREVGFYTNETIFELEELPAHLVILGSGPVGIELAQAFRRLGSAVTIVARSGVLGREDPDAAAIVATRLRDEGVTIRQGSAAVAITALKGGATVTLADGTKVNGSHLLLALGRKPTVDGLNLAAAGVIANENGIRVDRHLRSSNRRVFAIGDVAGQGQFTHLAAYHAGIVLRQAVLSLPARATALIPSVLYTDPELAQIGLTEADARAEHGAALTVQRVDYSEIDRAVTDGAALGFLKLMIVKGRPIGVTIVGPHAGEQIGLWSLALSARLRLSAVAGMVSPYPTLGEISKRAAGAYFSPRLFDSPAIKMLVRAVQRVVP